MVLHDELESLNLCNRESARPSTLSFSLKNNDYKLRGRNGTSQDLHKYPALLKLQGLVSRHSDVNSELDCCNVVCLANNKQSIRLHADNESSIDQSHPIATVSLGATRKVEFVPFGSSYDCTAVSVLTEHNSLYVMKPGTQSILQHRVVRGNAKEQDMQTRYSVSFRKHIPDAQELIDGPSTKENPVPPSTEGKHKTRTTLIVGDSFAARLDPHKLSKGRKNVINIAKGGNKIIDVIESLTKFNEDTYSGEFIIDQVFVSVGTNDIRSCRREGVSRHKGKLFRLTRFIKDMFPHAKLFFQSLIPLPITYENAPYIARNILWFNDMLYKVCKHERVFLFDVFRLFLLGRYRNPQLFPLGFHDIHPNKRGLGLLAREYIMRIHCKHFDPLSFN